MKMLGLEMLSVSHLSVGLGQNGRALGPSAPSLLLVPNERVRRLLLDLVGARPHGDHVAGRELGRLRKSVDGHGHGRDHLLQRKVAQVFFVRVRHVQQAYVVAVFVHLVDFYVAYIAIYLSTINKQTNKQVNNSTTHIHSLKFEKILVD